MAHSDSMFPTFNSLFLHVWILQLFTVAGGGATAAAAAAPAMPTAARPPSPRPPAPCRRASRLAYARVVEHPKKKTLGIKNLSPFEWHVTEQGNIKRVAPQQTLRVKSYSNIQFGKQIGGKLNFVSS